MNRSLWRHATPEVMEGHTGARAGSCKVLHQSCRVMDRSCRVKPGVGSCRGQAGFIMGYYSGRAGVFQGLHRGHVEVISSLCPSFGSFVGVMQGLHGGHAE